MSLRKNTEKPTSRSAPRNSSAAPNSATPPQAPARGVTLPKGRFRSFLKFYCIGVFFLAAFASVTWLAYKCFFSRTPPPIAQVPQTPQQLQASAPETTAAETPDTPWGAQEAPTLQNAQSTSLFYGTKWSYLRHEDGRPGYFEFCKDGTVAHNDGLRDYNDSTWHPKNGDERVIAVKESTFRISDEDPGKAIQSYRNFHRVLYRGSTPPPPDEAKAKALAGSRWEMSDQSGESIYRLSGDGAFREKWNDEIKAPGTWKALYGEVFVFEYPSGEKFSVNVADGAKIFVRNDAKVWHRAEKQVVASTGDIIPLSSYLGFTYDQLVQATRERFRDHRWKEHDARLAELALHIILKKRLSTDPFMFSVEFQQKVLPYALAQLTFIRRLGLDGIKALSADDRASNMAWQLFTNFPLLEKFANALAPEDNVANAINIWAVLTRDQPPGERAAFENLTIALALIYDTPGAGRQNTRSFIRNTESGSDEAAKAFAYFREKQKKGTLYLKCDEILPDELIWAVSPEKFSFAEYEWALFPYRWKIKPVEGVKFRDSKTRAESEALLQNFLRIGDRYERIAGAYNLIRYEANKPYPQYTMENILRLGGTCSNQTDFSVAFARAHGVPAGGIAGEEPNGINHNWTLFRGKNGWRTTGRGNSDYGISLSPQTGRSLPEVSFYLYDDLNRKNGKRDIALRLVRAAQLLEHDNARSGRMKLLEAAVRGCPGQLVFWEEWFTALAASEEKIPVNQLTPILRRYRDQFKKFPDFYFENAVRDVEVRQLFSQWSDTQIVSFMRKQRQQMSKEYPNRFDLILVSLQYETEQLLKLKLSGQVKILLETAVDDYGKGSFREYDRLLDTIIGIAQRNKDFPAARSVLVRLMSAFEKHHYKGRRDVQRLDTATLNLASARMNREKRIFEKLAAEFARIETENPRVHAENRAKEIGKDMEGVAKTMEKIKTKMTKTDG